MRNKTAVVLLLMAVAMSVLALLPATAGALEANQLCFTCHGDGTLWDQNFDVGAVDKDTACRKCHLDRFAGTHPYHHGGGICTTCHGTYGASIGSNVPRGVYAYGAFAAPESGETTASILHIIHSNPRFPAGLATANSQCASCHGIAACDACHTAPVDTTHSSHGDVPTSTPIGTWVGDVSPGVEAGDDTVNTMQYDRTIRCGAAGCHDITGVSNRRPVYFEDRNAPAYPAEGYLYPTSIETSSAWTIHTGGAFTKGTQSVSNTTNNRLQLRFTGERIQLVSSRDPYRGKVEIFLDGVSKGIIDQYNPTTAPQQVFYDSGFITPGQHVVTLRVTGQKHANARSWHVSIDQFRVYMGESGSIAPLCTDCHDGSHATGSGIGFTHDATQTITAGNLYDTGYGDYACNQCHVTKMTDEHARTSSAGTRTCSNCHPTYAASSWSGAWDAANGCTYGNCHPASSAREPHSLATTAHAAASVRADNACRDCHSADLRAAHNNQLPGNGWAEGKCLTCHGTTSMAAGTSCTGSGCHTASGVTSLANHGFDAAKHTPATFTRAVQGTGADGAVDDGGYECSSCHSAALGTAHSESPAVGCDSGGATGDGCHLNTTIDAMAVAKAGWPAEKCTDCHDTGAATTHDGASTAHLVAGNGCAGSGAGCHNTNDLRQLHAVAQNGGVKKYNSCFDVDGTDPNGCHNVSDRRPAVNVANACGSTSTGCHQDVNLGTHPSSFSHPFSPASYYSSATESGCTNQVGCHSNSGSSTSDFGGAYHPETGCTLGGCHQSASKPAFTGIMPTDCQECHGGAFTGAPNVADLAGAHYSETTHTASGTNLSATVTGGGTASATCSDCHDPAVGGASNGLLNQHTSIVIAGSPYGSSVGCGECHGDTRTFGSLESSGAVSWSNNKCEDCHKIGGSTVFDHAANAPAVTATSAAGCGATGTNCHTTYDLHTLHKDAASCALSGCHDFGVQASRPSEKRCGETGGCHATYSTNSHAHAADAAQHQPSTLTQANATFSSTACGACHDVRNSSASLTLEHSLSTSAKTTSASNVCRNCHNNAASTTAITSDWSDKDTAAACAACHGVGGLDAVHATPNSTAHSDVSSAGCSNSGSGCHNTGDLSQVGATNVVNTNIHLDCLTCHDRTASGGNLSYDPTKDTCGSGRECHAAGTQYNTSTSVHNGAGGLADGSDTAHHQSLITRTSYTGDPVYDGGRECATCHTDRMISAHANSSAGSVDCAGCHNSTAIPGADDVVKASWPTKKCTACHTATTVHASFETSAGPSTNHEASSTQGCASSGAGCHGGSNDLGVIHASAGCNAGNGTTGTTCHNVDKKMTSVGKTCGSGGVCHTGYSSANHNGISTGSEAASHEATAAGFSADITGGSFTAAGNTCIDCHSRTLASAHKETSTTASLKSGNTAWSSTAASICRDCHNTTSPDNAVTVVKTDNWSARTCQQCHGTGGSNRGNGYHDRYTAGTHTAGVGTTGTADGCTGSCHGSLTDVRAIHNRTTSGCTATGTDSKGWSGGCHSMDKQMPATAMSCGSGGSGQNCHANHTNDNHVPVHDANSATSIGCTKSGCHELADRSTDSTSVIQLHSVATIGSPVSGKTNDGCNICHGGSGWADVAQTAKDNLTQFECVGCHEGVLAGAYDPYDPDHYTGIESTHTASSQAGTVSGFACSQCHNTEMKPEHIAKTSSAFSTVPGTYADKCVACHEAKADSITWDKTCDVCHATKHAAMATQHDFTTGNAACAGSECHNTADVTTVHAGTPADGITSSCASCHADNTAVPTERLCADCHTAHPAQATVHASATTECTSCHSTKTDIATGHASCATCHADARLTDYLQNNYTPSCLDCHNATVVGTYAYSPSDPNHYNPYLTNHTATGMDALAGDKACSACHSGTLKAEHQLTISVPLGVNCVQCHTNSTVGGATQVAADWTNDTCSDCHGSLHNSLGTSHDMSASAASLSCSGASCHDGSDISTLHLGRALTASPSTTSCNLCHANADTPVTATGCDSTGCHAGMTQHEHELETTASTYSVAAQTGCTGSGAGCHASTATDYASNDFHPANGCVTGNCHVSASHNAAQFDNPNSCQDCHTDNAYAGAPDVVATSGLQIGDHYSETTHTATPSGTVTAGGSYSASCATCHNPGTTTTTDGLFNQHQDVRTGSLTCYSCHNKSAAVQAIVTDATRTDTCAPCHNGTVVEAQHGTTAPAVAGTEAAGAATCAKAGCHATLDLHALHANNNSGNANGCTMSSCHDPAAQGAKPTAKSCGAGGACHTSEAHPAHTASASSECVSCHETSDVKVVHAGAGEGACAVCHAHPTYGDLAATTTGYECTTCHKATGVGSKTLSPADPNHYTGTESTHTASSQAGTVSGFACSQCHNTEMKPEHITKTSSAFSTVPVTYADKCVACHEAKADSITWDKTCDVCHATKHTAMATQHDFTTGNAACAGSGCHNTADVTAVHAGTPADGITSSCASCHADNTAVPTERLCADCHTAHPAQATVHASATTECTSCHTTKTDIATGHASCATCHADARLTDYLQNNYTPSCLDCHNATVVGTHAYSPVATNHFNATNHTSTTQGSLTYSLNGQTPTCGSCHSMRLDTEHSLGTSALTGTGSVCERCHTNAGSTTAVSGQWSGELCAACHDGSGITTQHGNVGGHTVANAGCGASGAGCHPTSDLSRAGADKSVNIHNDCATCHDPAGAASWTYGVAGNMKYNPLAKSCGQATGCHTAAFYSTTAHNIGQASLVDGTDAKHTAAAANMDDLVGSYVYDNACSSCHSSALKTAHATTSLAVDAGCTSGGTDNNGCHNSTVLANSPVQVKANWSTDACADCHTTSHTTYTVGTHTATAAGCALSAGCHGSDGVSQTLDIRGLHDTVNAGCTATGSDSLGWTGGCHALDTPMSGALTCGDTGACHSNHTASNHMPDHLVTTATSLGCTTSGCHESGAARDIATTSVIDLHSPTTIGSPVSGKTNDGCNICHGGSGWTDKAATVTDFECVGCHANESPYDSNHYVGTETTHTASSQAGTVSGFACTQCHKTEMKPEHITKTSSAFSTVPGTYSDKCVACHEAKADTITWNKTCDVCHATKHDATATKHDASVEGAGCAGAGGGTAVVSLHAENFDSGSTWPAAWTKGGANQAQLAVSSADASSAPNSARFAASSGTAQNATFQQTFNTSALTNPTLTFAYKTAFPGATAQETLAVGEPTAAGGWTPATGWTTQLASNTNGTTIITSAANTTGKVAVANHVTGTGRVTNVTMYVVANTAQNESLTYGFDVGGTTSLTTQALTTTYTQYSFASATSPSGAEWSWTDIDNLQGHLQAAMSGQARAVNVERAYIVVDYEIPASTANNYLKAEYSTNGGSSWTPILNQTADAAWSTSGPTALPQAAALIVRFSAASDETNRLVFVDDISITHEQTTASCHDVTDVAAIHNNSASTVTAADTTLCATCHVNSDAVPTVKTCTNAGCHGSTAHVAVHISARVECTSCHGATNIQTLHAGKGDGCNVCHGGGGFTDVAGGKTADCVDCHNSSGSGVQKTYSPISTGHYVGTETSHTATAAQSGSTLNWADNPTCGACHAMELYPEHNAVTAAKTTVPANVCENCHMSTALTNAPTVVDGDWSARSSALACVACHAVDTATNQHGSVAITGNHGVTGDTQSCASSGVGCHPVSNVAQVGTPSTTANIHTACASCHGTASRAGLVTPGALAQGCTGNGNCHNVNYATNNHNALTGNEAIHTATGMGTDFSAYANKDLCSDCHSGTLGLAHNEASTTALLGTGRTAWSSTAQSACRDCHNAAATTNYAASGTVVKGNWATKACSECHTRAIDIHNNYSATSHTASTSGCTLNTGCHGFSGSQSIDIRTLHDTATSGCTATGTDGKGWTGGCHALDKPLAGTTMTCGDTGACHNGHTDSNHGPDHTYTTASDYTQTADTVGSEAGCTDSGAGCHGTAGGTRDAVTEYHTTGKVTCLSSACHTSSTMTAGWKTGGTGADCSRCHNNNFVNAADKMPLFEAASAGHYGEATHTATSMSTVVKVADGTAQAVCSDCHSTGLRNAHGAAGGPLATSTKGAYVTCQECHAYANVTPLITDATHTTECASCHTAVVLGATHAVHATAPPVTNVGNGTGCATTGNGCHANGDLHAIHKDAAGGCLLTGCHAVNKSLTAASTSCGQATGCHVATQYSATQHNGTAGAGLANGDDTAHHEATGNSGQSLGGYSVSTNCTVCHSSTLKTAHATTSLASDPSCSTGGTGNTGCHNQTTPINATPQVTGDWTLRTCEACHATKHGTNTLAAHTVTLGTSCSSLGTCHGSTTDIRVTHDRVFTNAGATGVGCAAAGSDSKGANPACHAVNKAMNTVGTMSCGSTTGSQTTKCHVNHTSSNHGAGGNNCDACHGSSSTERLDKMVGDTTVYHHVLDNATPFEWDTAYPNTTTSLACRSCHVDHANFNGKAGNLRGSYNDAPSGTSGVNSDFPGGGTYGVCVSCHTTSLAKNTTGQKAGGSANTLAISGANYDVSAHDYLINDAAKVGYGTSAFQANCIKCHDDGATGPSARQTGTYKLAPHLSAENRIAAALGAANAGTSTASEENLCYTCHAGGSATDGYGVSTMSDNPGASAVGAQFSKTSKHNVAGYNGKHIADEGATAPTGMTTTGWWGTARTNQHVECEDCHNVHEATAPSYTFQNTNASPRSNAAVPISGANKGVWGIDPGSTTGNWTGSGTRNMGVTPQTAAPTSPTYTKVTSSSYEFQMCLKCHSRYAWGTTGTAPNIPSGQLKATGTVSGGSTATRATGVMTDVGNDFNPMNFAVHPLFRVGYNQPATNAYGYWDTSTRRRSLNGGTGNGLSNTFVDGWTTQSRVTCSDCHGNNSWTSTEAQGPHGSANPWILRGVNTAIQVSIQGVGTPYLPNANVVASTSGAVVTNYCINCHRADVYGAGNNGTGDPATTDDLLSRAAHLGGTGGMRPNCSRWDFLYHMPTGCNNCHGARVNDGAQASGAIHGSSMGRGDGVNTGGLVQDGTLIGDPMGIRFMNGASWDAHTLGTTSAAGSCNTLNAADSYSACSQHKTGTAVNPRYNNTPQ